MKDFLYPFERQEKDTAATSSWAQVLKGTNSCAELQELPYKKQQFEWKSLIMPLHLVSQSTELDRARAMETGVREHEL